MNNLDAKAALFDLDGVVFDTERQYDVFWGGQGDRHLPHMPEFSRVIKGSTLPQILEKYFNHDQGLQERIIIELNEFEHNMAYNYIAGAKEFIISLREVGVKVAIVTSSNDIKMQNIYREHPDFSDMFDTIVTANKVTRSKPDPQCFLIAARELGAEIADCVVFEDSFHGLESGKRAGMKVVGLATTNSRESINGKADIIIDDFSNFTVEEAFSNNNRNQNC